VRKADPLLILHPAVFSDADQATYEDRREKIEVLRLELEFLRHPSQLSITSCQDRNH